MPATSKSQQRLMGQAYALKKGELKSSDLDSEYRDQIENLAKEMTLKQLRDYAKTSHSDLPKKIQENSPIATLSSVNGMGPITLPQDDKIGSGDKLNPSKNKKKYFKQYSSILKIKGVS